MYVNKNENIPDSFTFAIKLNNFTHEITAFIVLIMRAEWWRF